MVIYSSGYNNSFKNNIQLNKSNELVTNSLKYAFQNAERRKTKIQFQKEEENILLRMTDNGVEMP